MGPRDAVRLLVVFVIFVAALVFALDGAIVPTAVLVIVGTLYVGRLTIVASRRR